MAKSFRKFLATLLALVMLVSMTGISVLAEEVAEIPQGMETRVETPAVSGPRTGSKQTLAQLMAGDVADAAASVSVDGETSYYDTLQEAVNAAAKGSTVTLLRDVAETVWTPAECDVTLDLNGKTLYGSIWHFYGGELTITGDGTVDNTEDTDGYCAVYIYKGSDVRSTLTIESGTFKSGALGVNSGTGTITAYQVDGISIQGGTFINNSVWDSALSLYGCETDATISGGTYTTSGSQEAIGATGGSVVTISDVTVRGGGIGLAVNGRSDVTVDSGDFSGPYALKVSGGSTVTVNGGAFAGTGEGSDVYAVYATGEATVTLNDGAFSSEGDYILLPGAYNNRVGTNVTITGGTFTAGELAIDSVKEYEPQTLHISGGTFLSEVSDYCVEGYKAKSNEDGTYTVMADYAASVSVNGETTYYSTLQEAIDAAAEMDDGEETPVVDLLRDVVECVKIGFKPCDITGAVFSSYRDTKLVLNLNGHIIDGGQSYSDDGDKQDSPSMTIYLNTELTINGAGAGGERGKITGGYSMSGGGIVMGDMRYAGQATENHPLLAKPCVVTIRDVEVSGNYAWKSPIASQCGCGGAISVMGGAFGSIGDPEIDAAFDNTDVRPQLELDNVVLTDNIGESGGGGLFLYKADARVLNSEITNNQASAGGGGGIQVYNISTCYVENTKINNNTTNGDGGGIDFDNTGTGEIVDSEIKENKALYYLFVNYAGQELEYGNGGGLSLGGDCTVKVTGTEISGNEAYYGGGGLIVTVDSTAELIDSKINNNQASYGGGMEINGYYPDIKVTVTNCQVNGNTAMGNGGGICCESNATMTLTDTEICNNTSGGGGGGIVLWYGTANLENCTIKGNRATQADWGSGGGITAWPGTVIMDKCVVVNNTSLCAADDIYADGDSTLTATNMSFGDEVLTADGRPISGWYYDFADDYRWSETGYCVRTSKLLVGYPYKAAHGVYYNIAYDLDGGTLGTDEEGNELTNPTEYEKGVSAFTLNNPTKEGYTFLGWTGSNGDEAEETVSITKKTTGDLSYTANWELKEYNVIYKVDDVVIGDLGHKAFYGAVVTLAEKYVKAGYTVTDWTTTDASVTDGTLTMPAKDVTLTASTNAIDYTVAYDLAGGETTSETTKFTQHYGDATAKIAEPTRTGYTFQGWTPAVAETVTGDATYTAHWTAIDYTVTYDLAGGVTTSETTTFTQHYGDATAKIAEPTRAGYTFQGWTPEVAETVTGDATYTAQWTAIDYTVTYDLAGGVTTSETTKFTQHYGDATAKIAEPTRAGYTFQGWTPAVAETVTGDATYTAQWTAIEYKITYELDGGALAEGESNPTTYTVESATFTLKNPTKAGHTFLGWTGSNGDVAQTEVSVAQGSTGDLTFTAKWRANSSGSRPAGRPTPVEEIEDEDVPLAGLPVIVPELNHEDHVAYLIGRPDGSIAPLDNITRGEVATIFFRLLTEENRAANWSTSCAYTDMDGTEYFYNPVSTITKAALMEGYPSGAFGGGDRITRAEMATVAARFLSEAYSGEDLFGDIGGHWAAEYINRAATAGWFKTTNADGTKVADFRPDDYITRAEVVVMINRMLGRKASMDYLLPDMKTWPDNVYSESSAWYYLDIQEATNSHDYTQESAGIPEVWTGLRETPDWAAMERR